MAVKHDCVASAPVQTVCFDTNLWELHIYDNKTKVIVFGPLNNTGSNASHLVPLTWLIKSNLLLLINLTLHYNFNSCFIFYPSYSTLTYFISNLTLLIVFKCILYCFVPLLLSVLIPLTFYLKHSELPYCWNVLHKQTCHALTCPYQESWCHLWLCTEV